MGCPTMPTKATYLMNGISANEIDVWISLTDTLVIRALETRFGRLKYIKASTDKQALPGDRIDLDDHR